MPLLRLLVVVWFAISAAMVTAQDEPLHEPLEAVAPGSVDIWGMHITTVRAQYRQYTPKERASTTVERIRSIPVAKRYDVSVNLVQEQDYKGAWVMVNDQRIIGLLDKDAPEKLTIGEYAEQAKSRLELWLERRDAQQKPELLVKGAIYTAIASLCFGGIIFLLLRGRERLLAWLEKRNNPGANASRLQVGGIYLLPYLVSMLSSLARLLLMALIALFSYLWLAYVMRQFPYTVGFGQRLTDYIVDIVTKIGLGILGSIPDIVMVLVIFWLASIVNDMVKNVFSRIERGRLRSSLFDPETAKATRRVIVVLVWLFSIVIAYPYIPGSGTEAFKGVSVFLGLIVSLGSAGIVSQVLGGLIVVYSRAFQPGEYVKVSDYEGTVTTVGVLSTKIKTIKNEEITIPNAVLLNASSTNYSRLAKPDGIIISTSVTIGYDTPWPQVHHLLLDAAQRTEGVRDKPEPNVRQTALSDWYVEYRLLVHIDQPEIKVAVLSELHQHIQDVFAEADLQIMSPHFIDQPEQALVPAPWVAPDKAPATDEPK
ncbi:mechanosensitive ion channel family protein [Gilvimarinus agarilyticus]|uniref:mechanosensitive ion channel family protein n=1 Tax=Gilvimarinus agarilyticus TaxID=679259 RepID=UPI0006964CBB|nr:mechanosensitive ion channel domain-containing protein [Gilvimarinus agarilyticus]